MSGGNEGVISSDTLKHNSRTGNTVRGWWLVQLWRRTKHQQRPPAREHQSKQRALPQQLLPSSCQTTCERHSGWNEIPCSQLKLTDSTHYTTSTHHYTPPHPTTPPPHTHTTNTINLFPTLAHLLKASTTKSIVFFSHILLTIFLLNNTQKNHAHTTFVLLFF